MALNINWYPGHMKKTKEDIEKNLKPVDIVLEIIDARIPESSRNPMLDDIYPCTAKVIKKIRNYKYNFIGQIYIWDYDGFNL